MSNYLNSENLKCNVSLDLNWAKLDECQESTSEFYDIMENTSDSFNNMFRNKFIEAFKRDCPDIVKNFKNDDEIWNFIMVNSKMVIKEEEDNE